MALIAVPGAGAYWPDLEIAASGGASPQVVGLSLTAAGHKLAWLFVVPKTGDLRYIEFRTGAITSWQNLRLSFQDPDASVFPDGVQDQFVDITASPGANTWVVPPNAMTSDGTAGGTKRTVTEDQLLFAVIEFVSTGGNLSITTNDGNMASTIPTGTPGLYLNTASWVKQAVSNLIVALRYDDGTYYPMNGIHAWTDIAGATFNNTSTPDVRGARFQVPFPCSTTGLIISIQPSAGADFRVILVPDNWDGQEGTIVATTGTIDGDVRGGATNVRSVRARWPKTTLTKDTWYRWLVEPLTATSVTLYHGATSTAALLQQSVGANYYYTSAKNPTGSGDFTNVTTQVPLAHLVITEVDDGATTGGGNIFVIGE